MWLILWALAGCRPHSNDTASSPTPSEADSGGAPDTDTVPATIPIPAGIWGGQGWRLQVADTVWLETDCAHGGLPSPLEADERGQLAVDFGWVTEGGPASIDTAAGEEGVPASLHAAVAATVIEGTVEIPSLAAVLPIRVELGVEPMLTKCL